MLQHFLLLCRYAFGKATILSLSRLGTRQLKQNIMSNMEAWCACSQIELINSLLRKIEFLRLRYFDADHECSKYKKNEKSTINCNAMKSNDDGRKAVANEM